MSKCSDSRTREGMFDRVTMHTRSGRIKTFQGKLPYHVDGFHWQFVTEDTTRLKDPKGSRAVGTVDGQRIARGVVSDVVTDSHGLAELFVSPPR